jgi:hypothetical protein
MTRNRFGSSGERENVLQRMKLRFYPRPASGAVKRALEQEWKARVSDEGSGEEFR